MFYFTRYTPSLKYHLCWTFAKGSLSPLEAITPWNFTKGSLSPFVEIIRWIFYKSFYPIIIFHHHPTFIISSRLHFHALRTKVKQKSTFGLSQFFLIIFRFYIHMSLTISSIQLKKKFNQNVILIKTNIQNSHIISLIIPRVKFTTLPLQ